jgi:hypothetical protein
MIIVGHPESSQAALMRRIPGTWPCDTGGWNAGGSAKDLCCEDVAEARAIKRLLTTSATWVVVGMSANTQRTAYNIDQYLARPARHEHCPSQSSGCRVQLGVIDEAALFIATAVRAVTNSPFSFYDRRSSTVKTRECLERSTSSAGPRAIGQRMLDGEQCQRGRVWVSRTQGWTESPPAPNRRRNNQRPTSPRPR